MATEEKTSAELDEEYLVDHTEEDEETSVLLSSSQKNQLATLNLKDLAVVLLRPAIETAILGALSGKSFETLKVKLKLTDEQVEELGEYLVEVVNKLLTKVKL